MHSIMYINNPCAVCETKFFILLNAYTIQNACEQRLTALQRQEAPDEKLIPELQHSLLNHHLFF